MIGNKQPDNRLAGFSLIEMLVAVTLFSTIILSSTGIFKMVIDSQRNALATQNVQESLKFFLEMTGKEIRMAQRNQGTCPGVDSDDIYGIGTENGFSTLSFKNYYGECVKYSVGQDSGIYRFQVARGGISGYISPAKIAVDRLDFLAAGGGSETTSEQAKITINLKAHALGVRQGDAAMDIQTTVTSRYYK